MLVHGEFTRFERAQQAGLTHLQAKTGVAGVHLQPAAWEGLRVLGALKRPCKVPVGTWRWGWVRKSPVAPLRSAQSPFSSNCEAVFRAGLMALAHDIYRMLGWIGASRAYKG